MNTGVRRHGAVLRPNPRRVITRLFIPGQEPLIRGDSRAEPVIRRILELTEEDVQEQWGGMLARFAHRHVDLDRVLTDRFAQIEPRFEAAERLSRERRQLAAAYFTSEFAIEAAALFNPSMVAHPDQTGLPAGTLRFVVSLRAVGEGHVSSIEFRTGTVDARGSIEIDEVGDTTVLPTVLPTEYSKAVFVAHYGRRRADAESADFLFEHLPDSFDDTHLRAVLHQLRRQTATRGVAVLSVIERFEWMAQSTYSLRFQTDSALWQRVIFPHGPSESHGMEDVRLTRFTDEHGRVEYRGTYTAFSGDRVEPQQIVTDDFGTFHVSQLAGQAAQNKGMAFFPRPVAGRQLALSRWDRETISLAELTEPYTWEPTAVLERPTRSWDLLQMGNCGPPIETPAGWLVLTHGVGPMRRYAMGALLLDLADPARVVGSLDEPLLEPDEEERIGYVPNVVYSCGALVNGDVLVIPYGASDASVRFATVDLPWLLDRLQ